MNRKIGACASLPLTIAFMVTLGCSMFQEPGIQIPSGEAIPTSEIPANIIPSGSLPDGTKAQRLNGGEMYRLDYPDGKIIFVGPNGIAKGGIL